MAVTQLSIRAMSTTVKSERQYSPVPSCEVPMAQHQRLEAGSLQQFAHAPGRKEVQVLRVAQAPDEPEPPVGEGPTVAGLEEHHAAGTQHAVEIPERPKGIVEVTQQVAVKDDIERGIGECVGVVRRAVVRRETERLVQVPRLGFTEFDAVRSETRPARLEQELAAAGADLEQVAIATEAPEQAERVPGVESLLPRETDVLGRRGAARGARVVERRHLRLVGPRRDEDDIVRRASVPGIPVLFPARLHDARRFEWTAHEFHGRQRRAVSVHLQRPDRRQSGHGSELARKRTPIYTHRPSGRS